MQENFVFFPQQLILVLLLIPAVNSHNFAMQHSKARRIQ
jgi:hypothetical protein